jgi:Pseudouridylate synthase
VRIMVGTLVDIGYGRLEPAYISQLLAGKDRSYAGQTAPAHGLTLQHVQYDGKERQQ